jgi:integration host factor subunit alpha
MNVNKSHLIDHLHRNHDLPRDESSATIESLLEIIKHTLESGEDLLISGFGKFIVKLRKPSSRNPYTGNDLTLNARRIVTFKCSKNLREKMNVKKKKRNNL